MNPLTKEWLRKADADWYTALRELRARKNPNYDSACFHAQQCIEKYLKAKLQELNIAFPKTHDLILLLNLIVPYEPLWETLKPALRKLNLYAVEFRYPGESADKEIAKEALKLCTKVKQIISLSFE